MGSTSNKAIVIEGKIRKIGKRLKEVRKSKGLSQAVFSAPLQQHSNNYGQMERGNRKATLELIFLVHEIYKVNIEWLMTGKGSMYGEQSEEFEQRERILATMVEYNAKVDELVNKL